MKLSEDLRETYDGMIEDGTGFYDVIKIIGNAVYEVEQLETENARLRKAIEDAVNLHESQDETFYILREVLNG